jgi:hypothetical protein
VTIQALQLFILLSTQLHSDMSGKQNNFSTVTGIIRAINLYHFLKLFKPLENRAISFAEWDG